MIAGRYSLEPRDRSRRHGGGLAGARRDARPRGRDEAASAGPRRRHAELERAEREARLAARLNHPHVVAVFDLVDEDDGHWLVMEYVDGQTLARWSAPRRAARRRPRPRPLLGQAADALAEAHAAGIVHRDVKPSNILVAERRT